MLRSLILFLGLVPMAWASLPVGSILKIQGSVFKKGKALEEKLSLKQGDSLYEKDELVTEEKAFVRIQMQDETLLNLGPHSRFLFEKIIEKEGKRESLYRLAVGKLRAHVQKKAKEGESIRFQAGSIPLGVRGTEFLTTVNLGEKPVTDAVVLRGKISAGETLLIPGQLYNSEKGIWKTLSPQELESLKSDPEALLSDDLLKPLAALALPLSLPPVLAQESTASPTLTASVPQTATVTLVEKQFIEKTVFIQGASLPEDIKDALKLRLKFKKENRCFYWEYKTIPGSYVPTRFRRERTCDDYQEGL